MTIRLLITEYSPFMCGITTPKAGLENLKDISCFCLLDLFIIPDHFKLIFFRSTYYVLAKNLNNIRNIHIR